MQPGSGSSLQCPWWAWWAWWAPGGGQSPGKRDRRNPQCGSAAGWQAWATADCCSIPRPAGTDTTCSLPSCPHLTPKRRSASAHSRARSATWRQLLTCTLRSSTPTLTTAWGRAGLARRQQWVGGMHADPPAREKHAGQGRAGPKTKQRSPPACCAWPTHADRPITAALSSVRDSVPAHTTCLLPMEASGVVKDGCDDQGALLHEAPHGCQACWMRPQAEPQGSPARGRSCTGGSQRGRGQRRSGSGTTSRQRLF